MANNSNSGFYSNDAQDYATGNPACSCTVDIKGDDTEFKKKLSDSEKVANQFTSNLFSQLEAVALKGKSIFDALKSLALSLSQSLLKAAFKPLQDAFSSSLGGLFKGLLPFAKGGVLRQGTPVPFANGGVISSPITFPLSGGRTGLAGERGPEAIMPLARGPDGRLGVVARGGGGTNVTINIAAQDVESFRRSETQVAALLSRAITLGQRNL